MWIVLYIDIEKRSFSSHLLTLATISSYHEKKFDYRSAMVNSKSFVEKVFLRIKWKFELIYAL